MRAKTRKTRVLAAVASATFLIVCLLSFFPTVSAEPADDGIEVMSSEAVTLDTDYKGEIEQGRVITFFGLSGEGEADVTKAKDLEGIYLR